MHMVVGFIAWYLTCTGCYAIVLFVQEHHSFRSCRSTAETEAAEEDQSNSSLMPEGTKPAAFTLVPRQISHDTKDRLSQLAAKEAMVCSLVLCCIAAVCRLPISPQTGMLLGLCRAHLLAGPSHRWLG